MTSVQSVGEELTCFNGNWGQFELSVEDITNCVNVWHIGLLLIVDDELSILLGLDTSSFEIQTLSDGVSTNGKKDGIVLIRRLHSILHESNLNASSLIWLLKLGWCSIMDELGMVITHVLANLLCHILIETSQENGPDHDSSVITESCQESSALKSNV